MLRESGPAARARSHPGGLELRYDLVPDFHAVRAALAEALHELARLDLSDDDCGTVEIVLAEVLNNVVEHSVRAARIALRITGADWSLRCSVTDDGEPMRRDLNRPPCAPDPEQLPEGGHGCHLIAALADDVRYSSSAGCNCVSFRISLSDGPTH